MEKTIEHPTLGIEATLVVTQQTVENFADLWETADLDPKTTKVRKFNRVMLDTMRHAGMVLIHKPANPLPEWDPNQVEWLARKANECYTEATTVPPE